MMPPAPVPAHSRPRRAAALVLPVLCAMALVARRAWQMGPLPTGLDGGEWLAYGNGLLGGAGRATPGAYAPLVPAAIAALGNAVGPVDAVRIAAVASLALLLLAVVLVASGELGAAGSAAAVLAIGSASAVTEPVAFGGYPQTVAFAAVLAGTWLLARWLCHGRRGNAAGAAVAMAVAALAHHVYFPLGLAACGAAWLLWLAGRPGGDVARRRSAVALLALLPGIALAVPTLLAFRAAGYAPPLDAAAFDLPGAWAYATREASPLWLAATLLALPALWAVSRRPGQPSPLALAATGMTIAAGAGFALVAEPRLVPALLAGVTLALCLAVRRWREAGLPGGTLVIAAGAAALGMAALRGDGEAFAFFRFYAVLDPSTIAAAGALDGMEPGRAGIVAVREDRRGWPIGWWYEGLTDRTVAVGSDPRWLAFPAEREAAATVRSLFDGALTPDELRRRAEDAGVTTLVARKREWIGWERWLTHGNPAVDVRYDDGVTIVLVIRHDRGGPENAGV